MSVPETDEDRARYPRPSTLPDEVDCSLRDSAGMRGFVSRLEPRMLGYRSCRGLGKRRSLYGVMGMLHAGV
jgi:hypothetical protein